MRKLSHIKTTTVFKFLLIILLTIYSCDQDPLETLSDIENESLETTDGNALPSDILSKSSSGFGDQTITMRKGIAANCKNHREKVTRLNRHLNKTDYRLRFEIKFSKYFDFDRGGKVGYGMVIGEGVTGCKGQRSKDGRGGSFRIMWRNRSDPGTSSSCTVDNDKRTTANLIPYLYFQDMQGNCGNDFGKKFPIVRNKWYTVVMIFKANTGNNRNGRARLEIGEHGKPRTVVLDKRNVRWSNQNANRKVTELYYHFFRGGNNADWASHVTGQISIRKVRLGF